MSEVLSGKIREKTGKVATKEVRRNGEIPAVLYGLKDNLSFSICPDNLKDILKAIQSVDTSIDYLTAAQTGEDPLTISTLQKTMGRYRLPSRYRGDSPKEDA